MSYIIQTNQLTKIIRQKELVSNVTMHVKKGEIYGFLGPNGAGKTTVMKMLTNLWKPTSGTIELFGEILTETSYEMLRRMGSMLEFPTFYEELSGKKNLELHSEYMGYYSLDAVNNALESLDLIKAADKPVKSYSLGMKQRLGIARVILSKPELLILDEPTNGLDPSGMKHIRELLRMLCKEYGITILISSHILSEIESISDTIGILHEGKLLQEIATTSIKESNLSYIEIAVRDEKKAAYVLDHTLHLTNFKMSGDHRIRIYDNTITTVEISQALAANQVMVEELVKKTESLEDYFLKQTSEVEKLC